MKILQINFILIFFLPLFSYTQVRDTIPVKKANRIIIKNNRSARQNFFLLQSILLKRGYTATVNRRELTIQTKDSVLPSGTISYSFHGIAEGDSVVLTGLYHSVVETSPLGINPKIFTYDIINTGNKGSVGQKLFDLLRDVAGAFEGTIYYSKEKRRKGSVF